MRTKDMRKQTSVDLIKKQQLAWAGTARLLLDKDGYCLDLKQNVFRNLSPLARTELLAGDGGELGRDGKRCKAQALHSSAILACNFFDYWRGRDLTPLAQVFGTGELCGLRFEAKFPTGLCGKSPNIDVVLYEWADSILAIESKFTEPFRTSHTKGYLKPKYFETPDMWARVGLTGCQALADQLRMNHAHFEILDVAQLLKHMLGLATNQSRTKHTKWRFCCLWYRPAGADGDLHAAGAGSLCHADWSRRDPFLRIDVPRGVSSA